jgi:magnesium chelatase family protein
VYGARTIQEAVAAIRGESAPAAEGPDATDGTGEAPAHPDLSDVCGQSHARRALEVAAAGGHHLLMVGPPGCGKTMLARRLPGILPPLSLEEAIEVTCVYSAAGLSRDGGLMRRRPFRAPHHTISGVGLVGGGRGPRPGEITLAHNGVLFLDELPEFGRATLDVLRQPLEEGAVFITREGRTLRMPARATLVAAMNPCPCGQLGREDRPCRCSPGQVEQYRARVSGPLLDRFDMQVEMQALTSEEIRGPAGSEPSSAVAERVAVARSRQVSSLGEAGCRLNSRLAPGWLRRHERVDRAGLRLLKHAVARLALSARAYDAALRVARTIADLDGSEMVGEAQVAEAIQYRHLDRARPAERFPQPKSLA